MLLSDPNQKVTEMYGAWAQKKMYGKEGFGVVRSTLLIDTGGKIAYIWREVAVKGHVQEVISTLQRLAIKS